MARPRKQIDNKMIEELAGLNCSYEEISAVAGISVSTLKRNYEPVIKKGREKVKTSLKRKQYEVAMKGNVSMLIWLGKNMLGQKDKIETKDEVNITIVRKVSNLGKQKDDARRMENKRN